MERASGRPTTNIQVQKNNEIFDSSHNVGNSRSCNEGMLLWTQYVSKFGMPISMRIPIKAFISSIDTGNRARDEGDEGGNDNVIIGIAVSLSDQ